MKASIAFVRLQAAAAYTALKASASYVAMRASIAVGEFIKIFRFSDTILPTDTLRRTVTKNRSDTATASDQAAKSVGRGVADAATAGDAKNLSFGKRLSDAAGTAESLSRSTGKGLSDTAGTTDFTVRAAGKGLFSAVASTDGIAITLQFARSAFENITFSESVSRSISKLLSDSVLAVDSMSIDGNGDRSPFDSASTFDSGFVRSQSYADMTYFAEDYVGVSRSF